MPNRVYAAEVEAVVSSPSTWFMCTWDSYSSITTWCTLLLHQCWTSSELQWLSSPQNHQSTCSWLRWPRSWCAGSRPLLPPLLLMSPTLLLMSSHLLVPLGLSLLDVYVYLGWCLHIFMMMFINVFFNVLYCWCLL